ncbi:MAG: hypothetical protein H0W08_11500 [Acidobacteria bacterium]|nr:hypothetical protein [Acidobacteriota bacterium]
MKCRHLLLTALLIAIATGASAAQAGLPQTSKPEAATARPDPAQAVNIRVEVTISEQVGQASPAKKVVTLMTSDRQNGSIRSGGSVRAGERYRSVSINVDARPTMLRDSLMRLDVALEYQPQTTAAASAEPGLWTVNERVNVVLESGKAVVISETFDPTSDRRLTVELKATLLR